MNYLILGQIETTAFHPESNGSLERSHAVIKEYLKNQIDMNEEDWDDILPFGVMVYNSTEHTSTGYTPHELVFGRTPNYLSQYAVPTGITYDEYLEELNEILQNLWEKAGSAIDKAKETTKNRYDKTVKGQNLQVGDYVWIKSEDRNKRSALHFPYNGPYEILEIINDVNAKIRLKNKDEVVHLNRLKYANVTKKYFPV